MSPKDRPLHITVHFRKHCGIFGGVHIEVASLAEAFVRTQEKMENAQPLLDSVEILTDMATVELYTLVRKAWARSYRLNAELSAFSTDPSEVRAHREKLVQGELFSLLQKGEEGVEKWNSFPLSAQAVFKMDMSNLSLGGLCLSELQVHQMNVLGTNFDGITMRKGHFVNCKMQKAKFRGAILNVTEFSYGSAADADFTDASMISTTFFAISLKKAKFIGAKLSGTTFMDADLCGADFTDADMAGVRLSNVKVDEKTKFPPSLTEYGTIKWKGAGSNPYVDKAIADDAAKVQTTEDLIKFLETAIDPLKLEKALQMLKKDRFQLFSEHTYSDLCGIVMSQRDKELVYACSLDEKGAYTCCTQNLNACGGLRGSLCKHLLVLVIGLVNAKVLSAASVAKWCAASSACKPKKDEDVLANLFLRYKGAEAGEVDWRPTETMPEDYYAF